MACNSDMKTPQDACEADESVNDILTEAVRAAIIKATAETKADLDLGCSQGASYGNISEAKIADAVGSATEFVFKIVSDALSVASSKMVVKQDESTLSEPETSAKSIEMKKKDKSCCHEDDDTVDEPVAKKVCLETMSVFVMDTNRDDGLVVESYVFKFYEKDIPLSVWLQLTALKAAGKTFFPHVGNCGYDVLLPKSQKKADRRDFDTFFKQVIDDDNLLTETSQMDKISGCTFGICLVEE